MEFYMWRPRWPTHPQYRLIFLPDMEPPALRFRLKWLSINHQKMKVVQLRAPHHAPSTSATWNCHQKTNKPPLGSRKQRHSVVSCPWKDKVFENPLKGRLHGLSYKLASCTITIVRISAIGNAIAVASSRNYIFICQYIKGILLKTICS